MKDRLPNPIDTTMLRNVDCYPSHMSLLTQGYAELLANELDTNVLVERAWLEDCDKNLAVRTGQLLV